MKNSFRDFPGLRPMFAPASRFFAAAKAFTLIELLVVISIVAVLAALLLPVISKAGMTGKQVKSVSRLRDLQRANIQFASDHNQFYVATYIYQDQPFINEFWFTWTDFLNYFDNTKGRSWWWGNSPENVYSALIPLQTSKDMATSFGMNGWSVSQGRQMLRDVPTPARMMAFVESQAFYVYDGGGAYKTPETTSAGAVAYRYNDMTNAVFFDGHVETLPQSKIKGNKMFWDGQ